MAFKQCTGLSNITIPDSVTQIGYCSFAECSGLTSIVFPNSVTKIEDRAMECCTSLKSVTIPNSVSYMGCDIFDYCDSLTDVYSYITDPARVTYGGKIFGNNGEGIDYVVRTLHVPGQTAISYQLHSYWCPYFGRIVEDLFVGDVNGDGIVTIIDVTALIDILLSGEEAPQTADCNNDGIVSISDVTALIDYLLSNNRD